LGVGRRAADVGELLIGFSDMLVRLGVPLTRASTHAPTLHPEFRWVMRLWQHGALVAETRRSHGIEATATYKGNPVEHVVTSGRWLDCRLDDSGSQRFPVLRDLRKEGYTHYVMAPLRFSDGSVGAASWATIAAGGFALEHVRLLREVVDVFSLIFETKGLRRVLADLLVSYVGRDPARRILEGTVRRGDVRRIHAAIMLTDMRGFGKLSDELPEERVVELLNEHFDCIVPHVLAEGGEVLEFIGDGVLAVFGADQPEKKLCQAAFRAAQAALAAIARRNADGGFQSVRIDIGIALHCGEVAYGNIGSGDRLDFTAIGRDVNIVSRLERLCGPLERSLLMTGEFVSGLELPVVELGHFEFKGFKRHEAVFGVADKDDHHEGA
jgi:adenylate cyclase